LKNPPQSPFIKGGKRKVWDETSTAVPPIAIYQVDVLRFIHPTNLN